MIDKKQLDEIKGYLDKAENPLIFFDADPDGLSSFLLLKKYMGKGKGVIFERGENLGEKYIRKVDENKPDIVFVLDIFDVSQEFIDKVNVPIVWIDHHPPMERKGVKYFNPKIKDKDDNRPTTYWCYKITKGSLWIATVGTIADWYIPEFAREFAKKYPDLFDKKIKDPGEANFKQPIGELIKIFHFILKGTVSDAMRNANILGNIESPYEILKDETSKGKFIHKYAMQKTRLFDKMLEDALKVKSEGKLHLYVYSAGDVSFTSYLSNNVQFMKKDKLVIMAREHNGNMKMSLRSHDPKIKVKDILERVLKKVPGHGGGHLYACGAGVKKEDFDNFIQEIKKELDKLK
ncbi:DHH family phosphoesterase [Candidatus Woesearchaeota archaeon]|nr:DHH family phosphoesterase [Candidatus Woesearchaeota archaeon]